MNTTDGLDFPPELLERLLASRIVPVQAKIEAIQSWRRELAEADCHDVRVHELEEGLARAERMLKRQTFRSLVAGAASRIRGLIEPQPRHTGLARQPAYALRNNRQFPRSRAA